MDNPYEWLQRFIDQVPDPLQPLIVVVAAAIPYVEGEGATALGIIAGLHPVIAASAGATGNILCVIGVVALGSGIRERVVARRAGRTSTAVWNGSAVASSHRRSSEGSVPQTVAPRSTTVTVTEQRDGEAGVGQSKGAKRRARLHRWLVRFGVPGASILAPLALPTMLTAAFFVGVGIPKRRVVLWQSVAIVLWASAVAIATTGVVALLGW